MPLFLNESPFKTLFDLHKNEPVGERHFHINDFVRRLVLTPRQKTTRDSFQRFLVDYFTRTRESVWKQYGQKNAVLNRADTSRDKRSGNQTRHFGL